MMLGYAMIEVSIKTQTLTLLRDKEIISRYPISSAKKGVGQVKNSNCTPLGSHIIRAKIGAGYPMHAIFHARRWKGELWDPDGKIDSEDLIYQEFYGYLAQRLVLIVLKMWIRCKDLSIFTALMMRKI